jgi:hypothetical protein
MTIEQVLTIMDATVAEVFDSIARLIAEGKVSASLGARALPELQAMAGKRGRS